MAITRTTKKKESFNDSSIGFGVPPRPMSRPPARPSGPSPFSEPGATADYYLRRTTVTETLSNGRWTAGPATTVFLPRTGQISAPVGKPYTKTTRIDATHRQTETYTVVRNATWRR
jgi:hypothetical protein